MKHEFENIDTNKHLINVFESGRKFGILTSKTLPEIANFPLFMHQGTVLVSIQNKGADFYLENDIQLKQLRNFHTMVFRDILQIFKYFCTFDNSNEENSYLLVPLLQESPRKVTIDWNVVINFQNLPQLIIPSKIEKMRKKYVADEWIGKVVVPWYSNHHNKDKEYMVVKVHENMSPLSNFPKAEYNSFKDFVETVYKEKVERTDMFMIEAKAITKSKKFFAAGQGKGGSKKKIKEEYVTMFIPELCHNSTFPADLWIKSKLLPCILHRLTSILVAEKLRHSLNEFVGINSYNYKPKRICSEIEINEDDEIKCDNPDDSIELVSRGKLNDLYIKFYFNR